MPFDIDQRMLVYLGMITAGIFIFPIVSDIPYLYQVIGLTLVGIGGFLVFRKSRKNN
jgi:LPXTG-motif cell wall-anchored protein